MKTTSVTSRWLLLIAMVIAPIAYAAQQGGTGPALSDLRNVRFRVTIDGATGFFRSVGGLSVDQEVIDYQNGDDPLIHKRPGRLRYGDITLKRKYTASSTLSAWIEAARLGNGNYTRKDISIAMIDSKGTELKRWDLFGCFPISWSLVVFDDTDGSETVVEVLVIATEWFEER